MIIPDRRQTELYDIGCFTVSFGILENGKVCEVFFDNRGKTGHDIDNYLRRMGLAISKRIQGEDFTPEEIATW